jgi:DNA-binding MarR family transcriptional regulator
VRWQRAVDEALSGLKLAHTRYLLLDVADRLEKDGVEGPKQRDLVVATQLTEPAVSSAVRTLEDQGFIDRSAHGEDARKWRLRVTPAGTRLLAKARPVVEALAVKFGEEFGSP